MNEQLARGRDYQGMAEVRALFPENPFRSTDRNYYQWKLGDNPVRPGHTYVEYRGARAVGSASITPKRIAVFDRVVEAAELGDIFTDAEFRRQGIFARGVKECTKFALDNHLAMIYGTPNSQSLPGVENKFGYPQCPFARVRELSKDLRPMSMVKRMVRRRMAPKYFRSLKAQLDFQFHSRGQFRSRGHGDMVPEVLSVEQLPRQIDGLWGEPRYIFFTVRDWEYLKWRFFDNPDDYVFLALQSERRMEGYMAMTFARDGVTGLLCDFVTWQDRLDLFYPLLEEAEKWLKQAGAVSIVARCTEDSPYFAGLERAGYLAATDRAAIPITVYGGTEVGRELRETEKKWHFTMADSDRV